MANERRLIDSAELISKLPIVEKDKQISLIGAVADVVTMVSECKPVDAVEVVRCKDCHWNDQDGHCVNPKCGKSWYGCPVPDGHYCSYGEPRKGTVQEEKSDRERLTQLLQEARTKHLTREVVDYLIANGVTFDRKA